MSALSHANLDNPTASVNNVNFGRIDSANDPRIAQLASRPSF